MTDVKPDLQLAGLSLWIYGRQFPDHDDYWDGNWLNVRVRVEAPGSVVETHGPIVYVPELESFAKELELLDCNVAGAAALKCTEPNLKIAIVGNSLGHVTATITVTPDHMTQSHRFDFFIDQTYLKPLIAECKRILLDYPAKGHA